MIIPDDLLHRKVFYEDLIRQCSCTRHDRFNFYQACRNYFLFGTPDTGGAPYKKIRSTVNTLNSFIYTPDTMRFSLHCGTTASQNDIHMAVPLAREVSEQWRSAKTNILFGQGVRWSLVYGCMLMKIMWRNTIARAYLVEPHQFGVLREDKMELADQEAFTHHYTITRTQLEGNLEGNPRKNDIMSRVGASEGDVLPTLSSGLQRLIIGSQSVGGVPGSAAGSGASFVEGGLGGGGGGGGPSYNYAPQVDADMVDMCDLYVWDDSQDDYRIVTRASPDVHIYDRMSSWMGHVRGVPPFTKIVSDFILYDYFWGDSFCADLAWLQDWRTERTTQVRKLLGRQYDPPLSITGGGGISEEKARTFRAQGGLLAVPTPMTKIEFHKPDLPDKSFEELHEIDEMFDDQSGVGHVLRGKGEAGVRSRGQADLMARLGSSRPKERAVAVEESAEDAARLILRLNQDHSEQRYQTAEVKDPTGKPLTFTAEQFTRDYEVKVDAHSSSPVFIEDRKHDAVTLLEARAIDRETLLDMFDPPNLQDLKERLKKIEAQELEQKKLEMQMGQQPGGKKR